jgi:hypothetical protein
MSRYEFDPMTHEPFMQEPVDGRDDGRGRVWVEDTDSGKAEPRLAPDGAEELTQPVLGMSLVRRVRPSQ